MKPADAPLADSDGSGTGSPLWSGVEAGAHTQTQKPNPPPACALRTWSVGLQLAGSGQRSVRMSLYGSQKGLNMAHRVGSKPDLTGSGNQYYAHSEFVQGAGNGFDPYMDGYTYTVTGRSAVGGAAGVAMSGAGGGMRSDFSLNRVYSVYLGSRLFSLGNSSNMHPGRPFPPRLCFIAAHQKALEQFLSQVRDTQGSTTLSMPAVHELMSGTLLQGVIAPVRCC